MKRLKNGKGLFYLVRKGEMKILQSREKRERDKKKNVSERETERGQAEHFNEKLRKKLRN